MTKPSLLQQLGLAVLYQRKLSLVTGDLVDREITVTSMIIITSRG